jgi:hypothetical protein
MLLLDGLIRRLLLKGKIISQRFNLKIFTINEIALF